MSKLREDLVQNTNEFIAPPTFLLAHIVRFREEMSVFPDAEEEAADRSLDIFLSKINDNKVNINTTLIRPRYNEDPQAEYLKINTYADVSWGGSAGVLFRGTCLFLGFSERDMGSNYFGGFNMDGSITPEIMRDLHKWTKGKNSKHRHRSHIKITPQGAIAKLEENAIRRMNYELNHSSTLYFDINEKKIYTGTKNKIFNQRRRSPDAFEHNETHIRASLSDIEGFFVTKFDWDQNHQVALKTLNKLYKHIKEINQKISNDAGLIKEIQNQFEQKVTYYKELIDLLKEDNREFSECLDLLKSASNIENKELEDSFLRKKLKNKDFDAENTENKRIWLKKHIKKNNQDIKYLEGMTEYAKMNSQEEFIAEDLKREPKIYIYDVNKGLLESITEKDLEDKLKPPSVFKKIEKGIKVAPTIAFCGLVSISAFYLYQPIVNGIENSAGESISSQIFSNGVAGLTILTGSRILLPCVTPVLTGLAECGKSAAESIVRCFSNQHQNRIAPRHIGNINNNVAIDVLNAPDDESQSSIPRVTNLTELIEGDDIPQESDPILPNTIIAGTSVNSFNEKAKVKNR